MAKGWEIVEKRGDGLWYTQRRTFISDEGVAFRGWVLSHDAGRYALREIQDGDPQLTSSVSHVYQLDYGRTVRRGRLSMMDESKARRVGQQLAASLVTLFQTRPVIDGGAQYALGRTLAAMTGEFDNADLRDAFIEGVMAGFRQIPNGQLAAPSDTDGSIDGRT